MHNDNSDNGLNIQPRSKNVNRIEVRVSDEFYDLVVAASQASNNPRLSMGEVLAKAFAEKIGKPDAWRMDKDKPGPKPRRRIPIVSKPNGKHRNKKVPA